MKWIMSNKEKLHKLDQRVYRKKVAEAMGLEEGSRPYDKLMDLDNHWNDVLRPEGYTIKIERYKEKVKAGFWLRATLPLLIFVWLLLILFLPINFIFTGRWGYGVVPQRNAKGKIIYDKRPFFGFYRKWVTSLGLN